MAKNKSSKSKLFKILRQHLRVPDRAIRATKQQKQEKSTQTDGIPNDIEGSDGDVTVRDVKGKGLYQFTKFKGGWYSSKLDLKNPASELFMSNTTNDEILIYDESSKTFRNRVVGGDLTINQGVFSLNNETITVNHLQPNCINNDKIINGSLKGELLEDNTIGLEKFKNVTAQKHKETFVMSSGSTLNVAGAVMANCEIEFDGLPATGTAATGSIDGTNVESIPSGFTITLNDGLDENVYYFYSPNEDIGSRIESYVFVSLGTDEYQNTVSALAKLKEAIENTSGNITITTSGSGTSLALTHKMNSSDANHTITQNYSLLNLVGMTSGADGGNIDIPGIPGKDKESYKLVYQPAIAGSVLDANKLVKAKGINNKNYVESVTDANTVATKTIDFVNNFTGTGAKGLGLFAEATGTAAVGITHLNTGAIGADGNATLVTGDGNITIAQHMTGGVTQNAKYILLSRPLHGDVVKSATKEINTVVLFNVGSILDDGTHKQDLNAEDSIIDVELLSSDSAANVATKTADAINLFKVLDFNGDEIQPYTATADTTKLIVENNLEGYVSGYSTGTATGVTISSLDNYGGYYFDNLPINTIIHNRELEIISKVPDGSTSGIKINHTGGKSTSNTDKGLYIDYDYTAASSSFQLINNKALDIDLHTNGVTQAGILNNKGIDVTVVGDTAGAQTMIGVNVDVSGGDNNKGLVIDVENGGEDIAIYSSANSADKAVLSVGASGLTTLATTDSNLGTAVAHIVLDPEGDVKVSGSNLILDPGARLKFGGDSGDTEIRESSGDILSFSVGSYLLCQMIEDSTTSDKQSSRIVVNSKLSLKDLASTPDTPPSGEGSLYVNSDVLYYIDDGGTSTNLLAGGGATKHWMDWYNYGASLTTQNYFYSEKHNDEWGVSSNINTDLSSSGYSTTTLNNAWRMIRYSRRVPYTGTVTKFMVHLESTGAAADSDVEVALWWADALADDSPHSSTSNFTCAHLCTFTFDFSAVSRWMTKQTTSFNATGISEGDWLFITMRKTTSGDGSSFHCHSTILWDGA